MKLSTVNGTAFVDFSGSDSGALTGASAGSTLVITDHAGKNLTGYIKAAGTGETYRSELLANTAFSDTTNVGTNNSSVASVAGGQSGNCLQVTVNTTYGYGTETIAAGSGWLLKSTVYEKNGTGGTPSWLMLQNAPPWGTYKTSYV